MFERLRIERLKEKVATQEAIVARLEVAEQEYGRAYYTNKLVDGTEKLARLKSRLATLENRVEN